MDIFTTTKCSNLQRDQIILVMSLVLKLYFLNFWICKINIDEDVMKSLQLKGNKWGCLYVQTSMLLKMNEW